MFRILAAQWVAAQPSGMQRSQAMIFRDASRGLRLRGVLLLMALIGLLTTAGCGKKESTTSTESTDAPTATEESSGPAKSPEKEASASVIADSNLKLDGVDQGDVFELGDPVANMLVSGTGGFSPLVGDHFVASEPKVSFGPVVAINAPTNASSSSTGASKPLKLPSGFVPVSDDTIDGLPKRIRSEVDDAEYVLVPAGNSLLGTNDGPAECQPAVTLVLDAYYIGVREVTVGQVRTVKQKVGAKAGTIGDPLNNTAPADHPAVGIPWIECRAYAKAVNADLPTEAQWEKAARTGQGWPYPWGKSRPLWTAPRTPSQIDPVGSHPDDRSPYGALDLAGNAKEWLLDFYSADGFQEAVKISLERRRNWAGPRSTPTGQRVVKGSGDDWKVWARRGMKMTDRDPQVGFRCILSLTAE